MNKYDITTQKKKDAIVNASLELFKSKGFSATTIGDIAKRADVAKASIYNYFGSKEALVLEVAVLIMKDTIALAEEILVSHDAYLNKLFKVMSLCNDEINQSMNAYLEHEETDKQFVALVTKHVNALKKDIYIKYIELGKQEGMISPKISTKTIEFFIDSINNTAGNAALQGGALPEDELIQLFLYGIIGK